jgi:flagellar motor switch protein FliN/FliY
MSEPTGTEDQDAMAAEWAAAMGEQQSTGDVDLEAALAEGSQALVSIEAPPANLDVVLDIPVRVSMEVGNTQIPIRTLLKLTRGSIVELDRLAGEPLDVLVNGTLIAHGEVVVVNEKFGIRLTDVLSPADRIKKLR